MTKSIQLLKAHEGAERFVYQDTRGYWTIGVGRNVHEGKGPGLRDSEIDHMLENDIREYFRELSSALPFFLELSPCRQDVLMDMRHNLGSRGFLAFKRMLKALSFKDYSGAAKEILDSNAARGPEKGLKKRYRILAAMMSTDRYPSYIA